MLGTSLTDAQWKALGLSPNTLGVYTSSTSGSSGSSTGVEFNMPEYGTGDFLGNIALPFSWNSAVPSITITPEMRKLQAQLQSTFSNPSYLGLLAGNLNPWESLVAKESQRRFNTTTVPAINAQYSGSPYGGEGGNYFSGARRMAVASAASDLGAQLLSAREQAYNNAKTMQLQATGTMAGTADIMAYQNKLDQQNLANQIQVWTTQNQGRLAEVGLENQLYGMNSTGAQAEANTELANAQMAQQQSQFEQSLALQQAQLDFQKEQYKNQQNQGVFSSLGSIVGGGAGLLLGGLPGAGLGATLGGGVGTMLGGGNATPYFTSGISSALMMNYLSSLMGPGTPLSPNVVSGGLSSGSLNMNSSPFSWNSPSMSLQSYTPSSTLLPFNNPNVFAYTPRQF